MVYFLHFYSFVGNRRKSFKEEKSGEDLAVLDVGMRRNPRNYIKGPKCMGVENDQSSVLIYLE
jgi:hypothetical protein